MSEKHLPLQCKDWKTQLRKRCGQIRNSEDVGVEGDMLLPLVRRLMKSISPLQCRLKGLHCTLRHMGVLPHVLEHEHQCTTFFCLQNALLAPKLLAEGVTGPSFACLLGTRTPLRVAPNMIYRGLADWERRKTLAPPALLACCPLGASLSTCTTRESSPTRTLLEVGPNSGGTQTGSYEELFQSVRNTATQLRVMSDTNAIPTPKA